MSLQVGPLLVKKHLSPLTSFFLFSRIINSVPFLCWSHHDGINSNTLNQLVNVSQWRGCIIYRFTERQTHLGRICITSTNTNHTFLHRLYHEDLFFFSLLPLDSTRHPSVTLLSSTRLLTPLERVVRCSCYLVQNIFFLNLCGPTMDQ